MTRSERRIVKRNWLEVGGRIRGKGTPWCVAGFMLAVKRSDRGWEHVWMVDRSGTRRTVCLLCAMRAKRRVHLLH